MLFKTKEYLATSLSDMKIFAGEEKRNIVEEADEKDILLSDGTKVKLFFEYRPKNIRDYGVVKEIITGVKYERTFVFFKNGDDCLYSKAAGTVCFENLSSKNIRKVKSSEVKQYLKNLKEKNLYGEYIEKLNNFYTTASMIRKEPNSRSK